LAVKHAGARTGANRRSSVVNGGQQLAVGAGALLVLRLHGRGSEMALTRRYLIGRIRPRGHATRTTIKARVVVDHGAVLVDDRGVVVGIVDDGGIGRINIVERSVVVANSTTPFSAEKSDSGVPTAVIDSTIKPNVRSPVAGVPHIETFAPSPVTGRPQQTDFRWLHPGSWHPVVAVG